MERRVEVQTRWAFRMPSMLGQDAVARRRGTVVMRLLHVGDEPVVVRAAQTARDRVLIGAEGADAGACDAAIERARFWLAVDDDLAAFHERFRHDPIIGPVVRSQPWLRAPRRPEPFEALAWAITEQLIDFPRAAAIQRRIVFRLGRRCERTGLRDLPSADRLGRQAPALLQSLDLSAGRSLAMVKCAREVAAGRVDLHDPDHERGWRRLRAIPGIGSWTLEILALHGQGRHDQVPAGDLNLIKLVARLRTGSPHARATEDEVREFFAPYEPWGGLAAVYALRTPALMPSGITSQPLRGDGITGPPQPADPRRGRTRRSTPVSGPLAA
jgi:DNA-3-methyladenine glycosylase II